MSESDTNFIALCEAFKANLHMSFKTSSLLRSGSEGAAVNDIANVCALLKSGFNLTYRWEDKKWIISLPGAHAVGEGRSTMRRQDGTVERMLGCGSISGSGATIAEAAQSLKKEVFKTGSYLVSNQQFGLFCTMDDDLPHLITPIENGKALPSFEYDEKKVRALLKQYSANSSAE